MTEQTSTVLARHVAHSPLGRISLAGFIRNGRGIPAHPLRVLGSYAVVYLVDGAGRYTDANGLSLPVVPGDLLFVFPDLGHTYGPVGRARWSELFLVFDGPVFDLWRASGLLDPARPLYHLDPIEHWAHRFESVLGAPRRPGVAPPLVEVCRLQEVLSEALLAAAGRGGTGEDAAWVERACALLEADIGRDVDLTEIADDLGMSYAGFRKRFTRAMAVPPARYRATRLVDRACELMQQGGLTDRQIAESLGYCDEFYFSRRFKQVTGQSPRQFRATLLQLR